MKSIIFESALGPDGSPARGKDELLLLNTSLALVDYVRSLLYRSGSKTIQTPGGRALPLEICHVILTLAIDEIKQAKPSFSLDKASIAESTPQGKMLRCEQHASSAPIFSPPWLYHPQSVPAHAVAGRLVNATIMADFDRFLADATPEVADRINQATGAFIARHNGLLGRRGADAPLSTPPGFPHKLYESEPDMLTVSSAMIPRLTRSPGPQGASYLYLPKNEPAGYSAGVFHAIQARNVIERIEGGAC